MKNFFRPSVIIGTLPVTLTNGTTADAVQVMADLNWIVNQVNANAADIANVAFVNVNNSFSVIQSGQAATQAANFPIASQVQNSVFQTFQSTLGTNTISARCAALPLTSWPTDAVFSFIPSQTNTGPASLAVDSAGSSIIFSMGSTLVGGELRAGVPAIVKRDSSRLNLINQSNVRMDLASSASGGGVRMLISAMPIPITLGKQPSRTVITSGSGTYSTPSGCTRIELRAVGGGGGGSGNAAAAATSGGNTTFGPCTASGGTGSGGVGGAGGGAASGGDVNIPGGAGGGGGVSNVAGTFMPGGHGGSTPFGTGAGGAGNNNPAAPPTNTGCGGGGGGAASATDAGGGGGGGGYVEKRFNAPSSSYSYGVGAGGAGTTGTASTGATGATGIIIIDEFYN